MILNIKKHMIDLLKNNDNLVVDLTEDKIEDMIDFYLHGYCDAFAFAYQNIFGGTIFGIFDKTGLIHCFVSINGLYVDANGFFYDVNKYLYENYGDFWSPFENDAPKKTTGLKLIKMSNHSYQDVEIAMEFIKKYKKLYEF